MTPRHRLRCESVAHDAAAEAAVRKGLAIVTRCVRCGKATCTHCEGADDGLAAVCDRCAGLLHFIIETALARGDRDLAFRVIAKWEGHGKRRLLLETHGLSETRVH